MDHKNTVSYAIIADKVRAKLKQALEDGLIEVVGQKNGEDLYDLTDKGRAEALKNHEEKK